MTENRESEAVTGSPERGAAAGNRERTVTTGNWASIARTDVTNALRSRLLWVVTALLTAAAVGAVAIPVALGEGGSQPAFADGVERLYVAVGLLAPVLALVVGHRAIVGERESGTMRLLLGLPNSRRDVFLGKVASRFAVMAVATGTGLLAGAFVLAALYAEFSAVTYLLVSLHVLTGALLYLAVAVAISASVTSSGKAVAGIFGVYLLLSVFWEFLPDAVHWLVTGTLPAGEPLPAWYVFLERLHPGQALDELLLVPRDAFADATLVDVQEAAVRAGGDPPFYLGRWVAPVIVIAWLLGPIAVGYARFRTTTLD